MTDIRPLDRLLNRSAHGRSAPNTVPMVIPALLATLLIVTGSPLTQGHAQSDANREREAQAGQETLERVAARLPEVELNDVTFRDALVWWSNVTGVSVVADWDEMELFGVDPRQRISLNVSGLSAGRVLILILDAGAPGADPEAIMIGEVHDRYVEVMTKAQANRHAYTVVYDAAEEALPTYDNFNDAPSFDLDSALEDQTEGGSNGSFFGEGNENNDRDEERERTGEDIVELIRQVVEPELWEANGGEVARALYRRNRIIVRAPSYVHDQIPLRPIIQGDN